MKSWPVPILLAYIKMIQQRWNKQSEEGKSGVGLDYSTFYVNQFALVNDWLDFDEK